MIKVDVSYYLQFRAQNLQEICSLSDFPLEILLSRPESANNEYHGNTNNLGYRHPVTERAGYCCCKQVFRVADRHTDTMPKHLTVLQMTIPGRHGKKDAQVDWGTYRRLSCSGFTYV